MPIPDINALRQTKPVVLCVGSHPGIIQSILDFDFLLGSDSPSVKAIIATGRKSERYFFGNNEVAIPVYGSIDKVPVDLRQAVNLFINLTSGRRVLSTTKQLIDDLPNLKGGTIFAERLPEKHALELGAKAA